MSLTALASKWMTRALDSTLAWSHGAGGGNETENCSELWGGLSLAFRGPLACWDWRTVF